MTWPFGDLVPLSYRAIYVDPPWHFENYSAAGEGRHANNHYPTMDLAAIKALPVGQLAAGDCALFMWISDPMLPQALEVLAAWGFTYKTVAFTWTKTRKRDHHMPHMGAGYWTRANPEQCWLATCGAPKRRARDVRQWVETLDETLPTRQLVAPVREHSRKPPVVAAAIERLVDGPYVELFARQARRDWHCWGNQTDRFAPEHPRAAAQRRGLDDITHPDGVRAPDDETGAPPGRVVP